jgi:hypothetical protein
MACVGEICLISVAFFSTFTKLITTSVLLTIKQEKPVEARRVLDFVLSLVLAELVPQLVKRGFLWRVLADSAVPVRVLSLGLGPRERLDALADRLSLCPAGGALDESTALVDQHFLRGEC